MKQFAEKYKTFSNADLRKIIDNPNDYQPLAVGAAKIELDGRVVNDDELAASRAENQIQTEETEPLMDNGMMFEKKENDVGNSIAQTVSPVRKTPASNWLIAIISIIFALSFLSRIDTELGRLTLIGSDGRIGWDFLDFIYFVLWGMLPIAVYLFWKRKKWGWILLCLFFANTALNNMVSFLEELRLPGIKSAFINSFFIAIVEFRVLDVIAYSAILWAICRTNMRLIYKVDKRLMLICIGAGAVITTIIWLYLGFKYNRI